MKELKTERPPPQPNWIEQARRIFAVPKTEIDRREATWRKVRQRKRTAKKS